MDRTGAERCAIQFCGPSEPLLPVETLSTGSADPLSASALSTASFSSLQCKDSSRASPIKQGCGHPSHLPPVWSPGAGRFEGLQTMKGHLSASFPGCSPANLPPVGSYLPKKVLNKHLAIANVLIPLKSMIDWLPAKHCY